jgi:hypothetical protein
VAETAQQAQRRLQAAAIEVLEEKLINLHLDSFPAASPPKAKPAEPVDVDALRERFGAEAGLPELEGQLGPFGFPPKAPAAEPVDHEAMIAGFRKRTLRDVPLIRLAERREAKHEALVAAQAAIAEEEAERAASALNRQAELDATWAELQRVRSEVEKRTQEAAAEKTADRAERVRKEQAELDRGWSLLVSNDPTTVQTWLMAVLSDWSRGLPGEVVGVTCRGNEALLTIRFEHPEAFIPEQRADITPAGRATVKKRTQTDRNQLYLTVLGSTVLAMARCAFTAAPGLERVAVLVVREEAKGRLAGQLAAIYHGRFRRDDADLASEFPADAVELAAGARLNIRGRTDEVRPVDLPDERGLRSALGARRATGEIHG